MGRFLLGHLSNALSHLTTHYTLMLVAIENPNKNGGTKLWAKMDLLPTNKII